jgi:UDP-N-acetyl-D-mannosaminuronate dehydrogenase
MPAQDVLVIGLGYVGLPLAVQATLTARLLLDTRGVVPNAPSVEAL